MKKRRFSYQPISARNLKQRRAKRRATRLVVGFLSAFVIVASAVYIVNSPVLSVNEVILTGLEHERQSVVALADSASSGKFLGLFSKKNFLLYPREEIARKIKADFSMAEDVAVSIVGFEQALVSVKRKEILAEICHSEKCLAMDSAGNIFKDDRMPDVSIFRLEASFEVIEGERVPEEILKLLLFFWQALSERSFAPMKAEMSAYGDMSFYGKGEARISFDSNADSARSLSNLDAVLRDLRGGNGEADIFSGLKYIDLRFGNKVFVNKK